MTYYAHSHPSEPLPGEKWQKLAPHLRGVAERAAKFAAETIREVGMQFIDAARAAGLLHDLGKYRPEFQELLRDLRAKGEATRHKQAGAAWAADAGRLDVAFAIAGHHGGLPDFSDLVSLMKGPGGRDVAQQVRDTAVGECPELATPLEKWIGGNDPLFLDLWVRLLFSCLVDADWLDTASHEWDALKLSPRESPPALDSELADKLLTRVLSYIEQRAADCQAAWQEPDPVLTDAGLARHVPTIRAEILRAALAVADQSPGMFSMTVPTGGGKTLTSLAFALAHGRRHGLRRVIYVAPYLGIIEQNAREWRRALQAERPSPDAELVFEHHSLAEPVGGDAEEAESAAATRLAQNWDAAFVVTTNVQFFESLFANQPSMCRKLHNIARSVVILDECQTLPPGLVEPTCSMLRSLSEIAGASIVLCTATRPAWDARPGFESGLGNVRPIVPAGFRLFERLRRVHVSWPKHEEPPLGWPEVAEQMQSEKASLCIVNTKRAAREVFEQLGKLGATGTFHLSTAMCPAHRLEVFDEVRNRLARGKTCRLVSTQLIEAGVDVDFPLVLRELAPLEAIVQSAGRCNREGRLNGPDGSPGGRVLVFRSVEGRLPRGDRWYEAGRDTLESAFLRAGREPDIGRPEDLDEYFRRLLATGSLDARGIQPLRISRQFETVWYGDTTDPKRGRYRIIEDDTFPVIVATWDSRRDEVSHFLEKLRAEPSTRVLRELNRFQVNFRYYELRDNRQFVATEAEQKVWRGRYDEHLGVVPEMDDLDLIV
jgi:CRISPR-associated endonuclease/helicase Cas3